MTAPLPIRQRPRLPAPGLSARLLLLTVAFVMLAEVLIYVPSVANFRRNWLNDRLAAAQVAALVLDAAPAGGLPQEIEQRLLEGVGARAIAVRGGGTRRMLALGGATPPPVDRVVDLRQSGWQTLIADAFATLVSPADKPIRVIGAGMGVEFVEIVLDEAPLREAMAEFSRNILLLSLLISGITASLVYLALQGAIVRPLRRLIGSITAFTEGPESGSGLIAPSRRRDEIGQAERSLARMEEALAGELRQRRRLADLGLAVSKINHELRNMLTTAQLLTDRLERATDPTVQRVAPRLVATLDRAIAFCEATLSYGRAAEPPPQRQRLPLEPLVEELADLTGLAPGAAIRFAAEVPEGLVVDADPDQLTRILVNLVRNAVQALSQAGASEGEPIVILRAARQGRVATIEVADNGPGVPPRARQSLFSAFQGSARSGGTGLGLPIAAELARLHGGRLALVDTPVGALFRLEIPDREG
ncbi:MAG TPA: HAMP domain-containing sensor histidine kinase [Beijerinckiaceae bacterium]|jgi:signal transduction histidine kinase